MSDPVSGPSSFEAVPTPDHRREYLDYEGEVSRGRGKVKRVRSGFVNEIRQNGERLEIDLSDPARVVFRGMLINQRVIFVRETASGEAIDADVVIS